MLTIRDTVQDRQTGDIDTICIQCCIRGNVTALLVEEGEGQSGGQRSSCKSDGLELHSVLRSFLSG